MSYRYDPLRTSIEGVRRWKEDEVTTHSKLYLFNLTLCVGGLQVVWATVMAEGSSYLISLGLPPSVVSLAWLAGPICGTLLQPYIGYKSDHYSHRWGRRRPFMIYGTIATIICINLLSWTSEIVRLVSFLVGVSAHNEGTRFFIQILAIVLVWALNISIQPVQSSMRALIVDACPGAQAAQANSFASFVVIVGSAIGYASGFIEMPKAIEWIRDPQFKGLCLIASISLGGTVTITCMKIEEQPSSTEGMAVTKSSASQIWIEIYQAIRTLPPTIKTICAVQFFAWLAWFPFLFNNVLYLSRLYVAQTLLEKMGPPSTMFYLALKEQSIRHAVLAMLVFAIVALFANICLPYLISDAPTPRSRLSLELESEKSMENEYEHSEVLAIGGKRRGKGLTLPRAWLMSHLITALGLFGATLGNSFMVSVSFIALLGISWTLTQWAPFALIGAEIASTPASGNNYSASSSEDGSSESLDAAALKPRAGIIMAIHNMAIAMPQMISAVVTALIFWGFSIFQLPETDAMRWVLRVGIVAACCAAWVARKLW